MKTKDEIISHINKLNQEIKELHLERKSNIEKYGGISPEEK